MRGGGGQGGGGGFSAKTDRKSHTVALHGHELSGYRDQTLPTHLCPGSAW